MLERPGVTLYSMKSTYNCVSEDNLYEMHWTDQRRKKIFGLYIAEIMSKLILFFSGE